MEMSQKELTWHPNGDQYGSLHPVDHDDNTQGHEYFCYHVSEPIQEQTLINEDKRKLTYIEWEETEN
jgi:hypothetical protein